jgi:hypothetical protein
MKPSVMVLLLGIVAQPLVPPGSTDPPPISRDVEHLCPAGEAPVALRGSPPRCTMDALQRSHRQLERQLRELRQHLEELKRRTR